MANFPFLSAEQRTVVPSKRCPAQNTPTSKDSGRPGYGWYDKNGAHHQGSEENNVV
ncbi:hypothetical protein E2C01_062949 [Portunus trituberculatus]|uniref:Uncharacterized protein n=1 Tax=Portunus trituberculatus TaxID=210409 RepID=A0A5B7H7X3_PORTR|nr:hypothetical protein [Portunus trituberculatus]